MVAETQRPIFANAHYFNPHQCYHKARLREELEHMYQNETPIVPKHPGHVLENSHYHCKPQDTHIDKTHSNTPHDDDDNYDPIISLIATPIPSKGHASLTRHHHNHACGYQNFHLRNAVGPLTPPATPPITELVRTHSQDTTSNDTKKNQLQSPQSHFDVSSQLITHEPNAPIRVQCVVRARIPTSNKAQVFLHVYKNNHDDKEHLAIVFSGPTDDILRSKTLDAPRQGESELDRMIRGAYVGRLRPGRGSSAIKSSDYLNQNHQDVIPLVRIHSECFTGETLLSSRCDCGEQLNVALRQMQEENSPVDESSTNPTVSAPRNTSLVNDIDSLFKKSDTPNNPFRGGVVIYLRQEGRGIGLIEKLKAYNLQDLGADTVQANLALGHEADERRYDVARAILQDLSVKKCRLLTNNPDKIDQLTSGETEQSSSFSSPYVVGDGPIEVVERVGMVPKLNVGTGADVDKYIRTKIERMRHLIDVGALN